MVLIFNSKMMCWVLLTFFYFLTFSCMCSAYENQEKVVHYTVETFATEIPKSNHFVMFYAPWCAHCKRLMPIWEQLAEMLNDDPEYQIIIAKVDCISDHLLCTEHDITGYPTLKFFKMGVAQGVKFRGTRDLTGLTSFINEQLGTMAPDDFEATPIKINGLTELTDSSFDKHIQKGNFFVKFYAPWCGYCQKLAPIWEDLARSLEDDPSVDIARVDCTISRGVCSNLEIKGYPTLLWIQDGRVVEKYLGQRSEADLKSFVSIMLGSRIAQMREDYDPDPKGIVILNGDNFAEGIAEGFSFVKFFAPWCAYCKRLSPTWEELSMKLMHVPNVRLVKVDCTTENSKNLCNEQEVEGFPTLFLYKNGKKISEYNGSRNIEDLYEFVVQYFQHDEL